MYGRDHHSTAKQLCFQLKQREKTSRFDFLLFLAFSLSLELSLIYKQIVDILLSSSDVQMYIIYNSYFLPPGLQLSYVSCVLFNLPCHQAKTCGAVLNTTISTPQPIRQRVLSGLPHVIHLLLIPPLCFLSPSPLSGTHVCTGACFRAPIPLFRHAPDICSPRVPAQEPHPCHSPEHSGTLLFLSLAFYFHLQHEKYLRNFG